MGKQKKIKRFKIKGIVMQIEKLNNDLGGVCAAKCNVTSKYSFFRLAIISEGKETWWLYLLIATKNSLNLLNRNRKSY